MFSRLMDETRKGTQVYKTRTICEAHREIYDILVIELAKTRPDVIEKIVPLLEEAFIMGVKLNKALVNVKLSQDFTADPNDVVKSEALRKERIHLVEMLAENNQILNTYGDQTMNGTIEQDIDLANSIIQEVLPHTDFVVRHGTTDALFGAILLTSTVSIKTTEASNRRIILERTIKAHDELILVCEETKRKAQELLNQNQNQGAKP